MVNRSSEDETTTEMVNETTMSSESDGGNETMTSGESSRSETNESSEERVSVEEKRNETGATEPSQFATTTQIIEFTYNGQRERYIVAQEVRVEVYNPDPLFDTDTDYELNDVSNEPDAKNDSIVNRDKIHWPLFNLFIPFKSSHSLSHFPETYSEYSRINHISGHLFRIFSY